MVTDHLIKYSKDGLKKFYAVNSPLTVIFGIEHPPKLP